MFRQFAIARFIIGFIIFVLTYMVATLSYDKFFHLLTAGMFALSLYIMSEIQKGHKEELAQKDSEWEKKINEVQERLNEKESEVQHLIDTIVKSQSSSDPPK